jgi:hypothetical protein
MPAQRQRSHAVVQSIACRWHLPGSTQTMAVVDHPPEPAMHARRRLLAASLALLSPPAALAASRQVRGSGRIATEKRAVSGFSGLAVAGEFEVELHQGSAEGVELVGDDDLLPLVETVVEGRDASRTLRVSPRRDVDLVPSRPIRVRVDLIRLSAVSLAGSARLKARGLRTGRLDVSLGGSGDIALAALEAERLAVNIGGSGKITVDGRAPEVTLSVAGSGHAGLGGVAADDVSVSVAGSGNADVRAERRLNVTIAGSGRVRHGGAAQPVVSIVGSGDVRRL